MVIKCSFCSKFLAKSETKNCGSCKAVIYCTKVSHLLKNAQPKSLYQSRECQKNGWRADHKEICPRISNPQNANDELRLWCTFWSPSFVYATTWALDVKNNPGYNMTHALMIFVKKTERTDPAHRYKIIGQCFLPISTPILKHDLKTITPDQFYLSVQDPDADDGFRFLWKSLGCEIFALLDKPHSASLAKLAVPILRHLTETVNHVDAMTMWDPTQWLSRPHPSIQPENITVMPDQIARIIK